MFRSKQRYVSLAALTAALLVPTAFSSAADIVDTAVDAGQFNTLVKAAKAAGLAETLKGKGPFTVFAPTDEAFAAIPEEQLAALLKPENKKKLAGILLYHVVPGKVTSDQVTKVSGATTANGQRVDIATKDGKVMVDGAKVVKADIKCDNGVIHVIDAVILPESRSIPEVAADAKAFSTLIAAAKAAGLVETLSGDDELTVFAPTDEAFAALPDGTVESLLKPENKEKLKAVLTYHVVPGRVYSTDALEAGEATTVQGGDLTIAIDGDSAMVNDAKLLKTDIDASNGVIHVIDKVLLPKSGGQQSATPASSDVQHVSADATPTCPVAAARAKAAALAHGGR